MGTRCWDISNMDYEGQFHSILQRKFLCCGFSPSFVPIPPTSPPSVPPPPHQTPSFLFLRKTVSGFSVNSPCFPQNISTFSPSHEASTSIKGQRQSVICGENDWENVAEWGLWHPAQVRPLFFPSPIHDLNLQPHMQRSSLPTVRTPRRVLTLGLLDARGPKALLRL